MRRYATCIALALTFFLAACGEPRHRNVVYVPVAPPPLVVENRAVAPGPGFVWIRGYHVWNGNAYVWTPGRWERVPNGRRDWVPGHWVHARHGWYWVEGHWR